MNSTNKLEAVVLVRPTLYIGLGGAGAEVLQELRRKILNTTWSNNGANLKLNNLAEFSLAQFIYYDLDKGPDIEEDSFFSKDLQSNTVKFSEEEKIVDSFDLNKYTDGDDLDLYPNIKSWLPLTSKKLRELNIDPSKGAGQTRAISRLYFFDKYKQICDKITLQLKKLKANFSLEQTINQLGFTCTENRIRIVIVASTAGGTGSGAFLDMGWLVTSLAENEGIKAEINLMLLMPTAYAGANKDRTQANSYAALMELEAAMCRNKANAGRWDNYDQHKFSARPFHEVYLLDSINLAQKNTNNIQNIYHMLAETLFDDFASTSFASRIRSIAVNQAQHKINLYKAPTFDKKFSKACFTYTKAYSSMGRSVLDTKITIKQEQQANTLAGEMLKAYFLNQTELNSNNSDVIKLMSAIENKNAALQTQINSTLGTSIYIDSPTTPIPSFESTQLVDWATVALNELGNTQQIGEMLTTHQGRGQIISKVLKVAENQLLAVVQVGDDTTVADPLIMALEQMSVATRVELFSRWIACAMPWVDANLVGDFALYPDQYKCLVGVLNPEEFENKFGEELNACMPKNAGITSAQLNIVKMDVSGRAVCYTEFSGLPLTTLRGIEAWRNSYIKLSNDLPLHTHIDITQFNHVIAPSAQELNILEEDFKYFLLAVMTGVLTRSSQNTIPTGLYEFTLSKGDTRRIGNERTIRQNGLVLNYREVIIERVKEVLGNLDSYCLSVLSALALFYKSQVYTPKIHMNEIGGEDVIAGFASIVAAETAIELRNKAKQKGLSELEIDQIAKQLLDINILNKWAKPIPDSNLDAYEIEVRKADEITGPRLKYVINPELLELGKSSQFLERFFTIESTQKNNSSGLPPPLPLDLVPSSTVAPLPSNDRLAILDAIKNASLLKDDGILSQVEFDALKADLLKKLAS